MIFNIDIYHCIRTYFEGVGTLSALIIIIPATSSLSFVFNSFINTESFAPITSPTGTDICPRKSSELQESIKIIYFFFILLLPSSET